MSINDNIQIVWRRELIWRAINETRPNCKWMEKSNVTLSCDPLRKFSEISILMYTHGISATDSNQTGPSEVKPTSLWFVYIAHLTRSNLSSSIYSSNHFYLSAVTVKTVRITVVCSTNTLLITDIDFSGISKTKCLFSRKFAVLATQWCHCVI